MKGLGIKGVLLALAAAWSGAESHKVLAFGGTVGNGGSVVFCDSQSPNEKPKMLMLDILEGSQIHGLSQRTYDNSQSLDDILRDVVSKISSVDSIRASKYEQVIQNFWQRARFVTTPLTPINDFGPLPIQPDPGCSIKQFAVQVSAIFPGDKKFIIDRTLWDLADTLTQAVLIVHEIVLEEAIAAGQSDSRNTRYFTALLFSQELESLPTQDYRVRQDIAGMPPFRKRVHLSSVPFGSYDCRQNDWGATGGSFRNGCIVVRDLSATNELVFGSERILDRPDVPNDQEFERIDSGYLRVKISGVESGVNELGTVACLTFDVSNSGKRLTRIYNAKHPIGGPVSAPSTASDCSFDSTN